MLHLVIACYHRVKYSRDIKQQRECYVFKMHNNKDNGRPTTKMLTINGGAKVGVKVKVKVGINPGTVDGIEMTVGKIHIKTFFSSIRVVRI